MNNKSPRSKKAQFNANKSFFMVRIPNKLIENDKSKSIPHYLIYLFAMLRLMCGEKDQFERSTEEFVKFIDCDNRTFKIYMTKLKELGCINFNEECINPMRGTKMISISFENISTIGGFTSVDSNTVKRIVLCSETMKIVNIEDRSRKIKDSKEMALRLFYTLVKKRLKNSLICRISYKTIKELTGINRSSISEIVECLERNRLLQVKHGKTCIVDEEIRNKANEYIPIFKVKRIDHSKLK